MGSQALKISREMSVKENGELNKGGVQEKGNNGLKECQWPRISPGTRALTGFLLAFLKCLSAGRVR